MDFSPAVQNSLVTRGITPRSSTATGPPDCFGSQGHAVRERAANKPVSMVTVHFQYLVNNGSQRPGMNMFLPSVLSQNDAQKFKPNIVTAERRLDCSMATLAHHFEEMERKHSAGSCCAGNSPSPFQRVMRHRIQRKLNFYFRQMCLLVLRIK